MAKQRRLSKKKLIHLRERMLTHASRKNHKHPEEIANEYATRLLEGLHKRATVAQAYIDILRLQVNSRSQGYQEKLNMIYGIAKSEKALNIIPDEKEISVDDLIDLKSCISKIKDKRTQQMFVMRIQGYTLPEIGQEFGIGGARVKQILDLEIEALQTVS